MRARRIAGPRPWCSSSGVTYPIEACNLTVLYSRRMRASSVSSAAGSVMLVRCGQSPLRWLKNDSTCAWSVGVPGRPWCWAIAISAMNWRVSIAFISDPLSDQATRIGPS